MYLVVLPTNGTKVCSCPMEYCLTTRVSIFCQQKCSLVDTVVVQIVRKFVLNLSNAKYCHVDVGEIYKLVRHLPRLNHPFPICYTRHTHSSFPSSTFTASPWMKTCIGKHTSRLPPFTPVSKPSVRSSCAFSLRTGLLSMSE